MGTGAGGEGLIAEPGVPLIQAMVAGVLVAA